MATINKFEELECWQFARELSKQVYEITLQLPLNKDYSLRDQIRSSSGSVMDNIAEGFDRGGNKEFRQFLSIAKASCAEVRSQLYRCKDQEYISPEVFDELYAKAERIGKAITGLMKYLSATEIKGNKYKTQQP